jgi:hypothetical protein
MLSIIYDIIYIQWNSGSLSHKQQSEEFGEVQDGWIIEL